ncbi:MAG: LptF/LptG family permease [Alphaproteobacteria bacterium]|nr:LptF/LptG family permease [Alphaproteobacteria bacterium]MBR6838150.1 LptF/LptG family permease [Alphaproteobacteria bacterium]
MAKTRILSRFLFRRFFGSVGLVLLIVCGIIFAVTFVERLPSNPTIFAALNDAWTRLVEYVPLFLPLAVFMGTLVAYYTLTRSSEGVIISGAGLSPYQMARPFLIGAFLIGVFATTVINPYAVNIGSKNITDDKLKLVDDAIWLHESSDAGYITLVAKNMKKIEQDLVFLNTTIYIQTPEFKLTSRIDAETVTLSDKGLETPHAKVFDSNGKIHNGPWQTNTLITPQTVLDRYLQPDQISFWKLPEFIKKMSAVGISVRGHMVQFWTLLFLPLTMIAMATLGVAFSQTRQRRNYSFGTKFGLGILTCFILYFLLNIFSALGSNGTLPTLLAIIAPPLIIISASGVFIAGFDTI